MLPIQYSLAVKRSDTLKYGVDVLNSHKRPYDLVGSSLIFLVKSRSSDPDSLFLIKKDNGGAGGFIIDDAGNGLTHFSVTPADMSQFTLPINLYYKIQHIDTNGDSTTLFEGPFSIS